MMQFTYKGYVQNGGSGTESLGQWETASGVVQAESLCSAKQLLSQRHIHPFRLEETRSAPWSTSLELPAFFQTAPSSNDLSEFCRQAALLLRLQVPLDRALSLCAEKQQDSIRSSLIHAMEAVERGYSLGQAFQQQTKIPPLIWQCLRAAELGDNLPEILERLAAFYSGEYKRQGKIRSALFYPQMVVCIAVLVVAFILVFLLPSYVETFEQANLDMPGPTKVVLDMWNAVQSHPALFVFALVACILGIRAAYLHFKGAAAMDQLLLRLPLVGDFRRAQILALLCRTLAMLLHVGVPLDKALLSSESIAFSAYWQAVLKDVRLEVSAGRSLAAAMDAKQCFPTQLLQLLYVGEESGGIADLLSGAGAFYDDLVTSTSDRLIQVIQPMAMLLIALVIGGLAVAMMMPLYAQLDFSNYLAGVG